MIAQALGLGAAETAWILAITAVALAVLGAGFAIRRVRPRLGLVAVVPVAAGALAALFDAGIAAPHPAYPPLLAIAFAALGVVGGYPLTVYMLGLGSTRSRDDQPGTHDASDEGEHGGIVVTPEGSRTKREVLRGGWVIGYLERIAVLAAIALGRFEIVAAVIAVKGLGRFTELDSSVARERFIIGTLTSLSWAAACGLLLAATLG